jgi:hypothetical protein
LLVGFPNDFYFFLLLSGLSHEIYFRIISKLMRHGKDVANNESDGIREEMLMVLYYHRTTLVPWSARVSVVAYSYIWFRGSGRLPWLVGVLISSFIFTFLSSGPPAPCIHTCYTPDPIRGSGSLGRNSKPVAWLGAAVICTRNICLEQRLRKCTEDAWGKQNQRECNTALGVRGPEDVLQVWHGEHSKHLRFINAKFRLLLWRDDIRKGRSW